MTRKDYQLAVTIIESQVKSCRLNEHETKLLVETFTAFFSTDKATGGGGAFDPKRFQEACQKATE